MVFSKSSVALSTFCDMNLPSLLTKARRSTHISRIFCSFKNVFISCSDIPIRPKKDSSVMTLWIIALSIVLFSIIFSPVDSDLIYHKYSTAKKRLQ